MTNVDLEDSRRTIEASLRDRYFPETTYHFVLEKRTFQSVQTSYDSISFLHEKKKFLKRKQSLSFNIKKNGIVALRKSVIYLRGMIYKHPIFYRFLIYIGLRKLYRNLKLVIKGDRKYE